MILLPRNGTGGFQGHKLQMRSSQTTLSLGVRIVRYCVIPLGSSF